MKNKIFLLLFILLSILIVGCEDKNESKENHEKVDYREVTSDEKNEMLSIIDELSYFDFLNTSFRIKNLKNQEILQFAYYLMGDLENKSFTEIEKEVGKYLDYSLEPENVICLTHYNVSNSSEDLYLYNSSTGKYEYNPEHLGHGGGGIFTEVYNRYVSSKVDNDIYEIVVYKAFSDVLGDVWDTDMGSFNFYASYNDAVKGDSVIFKSSLSNGGVELNNYSDTSKLVLYTYTFKFKDGNYLLTDYKIN